VVAPAGTAAATTERTEIRLWITDQINEERSYEDTHFNGRAQ